jgi:hypothetical protein
MYKLTFTLKQHTPIIHFQHDQDGATLRATEVKPKLDRFIIEKMALTEKVQKDGKDIEVPKHLFKHWFNDKDHLSLDYKLKIEPNTSAKIDVEPRHANSPMYFANMGNKPEEIAKFKHFKFTENEIFCSVFSFKTQKNQNKSILDVIAENIYSFFFKNNFGTRQSKGYGSFELVAINGIKLKPEHKIKDYCYRINLSGNNNWESALKQVSYFYKSLRGGINIVNRPNYSTPNDISKASKLITTTSSYYIKPLIFLFAKSLGHQWDKKTIKQYYFNSSFEYRNPTRKERDDFGNSQIEEYSLTEHLRMHSSPDILKISSTKGTNGCYYDFKDLLGLSTEESWKSYGATIIKENVNSGITDASIIKKSKNDNNYIERFKSPIFFKLIKDGNSFDVYIIIEEIPDEYKGSKYSIFPIGIRSKLVLEIPAFSIIDFFNFIKDTAKFNIDDYLPKLRKYTGNNDREKQKQEELILINNILRNFFTQIQNS